MFNLYHNREKGQGLVEYALILVLVAIVVIVVLTLLGPIIGRVFSSINDSLSGAMGSTGGGAASAPVTNESCKVKYADGYATGPGYPTPCYSPSKPGGYYP